jgi:hypothetical protein
VQIPTNYFAFTPLLGTSGLGPFTNDTTVPYPHGFTNSYTIAGGTNFPASRTNWYDTDYGLAPLPAILSNLIWTSFTTTAAYSNRYYGFGESFTSWAAAKTAADAAYAPLSGSPSVYVIGSYGINLSGVKWEARLFASDVRCQTTTLPTNFTCTVEWYNWSTNADSVVLAPVYDARGLPLIENTFSYVGSATSINSATNLLVYGNTNSPDWCATPPTTGNGTASLGFWGVNYGNALKAIVRWDVTNGFKFK